jgi:hypothetical protein
MAFKTNLTGYRLSMQCIFWQLSYFMPNLPIILQGLGEVSITSTFWWTYGPVPRPLVLNWCAVKAGTEVLSLAMSYGRLNL